MVISNILNKLKKYNIESYDILYIISFLIILLLYLSRIDLGFADVDESFYLSGSYRMIQGDGLFVHEWHVSQMWNFLMLPIMKLYTMLGIGNEGMLLNFRYIFLFFHMLVMTLSYIFLRKKHGFIAVAIVSVYALFTIANITALCYNYLGGMFVFLLAVLNFDTPSENKPKWICILSGLMLAGLVLCNPYCVIVYFVYLVYALAKKNYPKKNILFVHIGIFSLAILFLICVFSKASISQIIDNIPNILSDPEHPDKTLYLFFHTIWQFIFDFLWYFIVFYVLLTLAVFDQRRSRIYILLLGGLTAVFTLVLAFGHTQGIGYCAIMLPLTLYILVVFWFTGKKNWLGFRFAVVLPLLYAFCMNLSSNQGIYIIACACVTSTAFSVAFFADWLKEQNMEIHIKRISFTQSKACIILVCAVIFCQLISQIHVMRNHVFWETDVKELKYEITCGPLKGIKTTQDKQEFHELVIKDIESVEISPDEYICFFKNAAYGYYVKNARIGSYSAWGTDNNLNSERLKKYYTLNPERRPNVIFVLPDSVHTFTESQWTEYCAEYGYTLTVGKSGSYILQR